MNKNTTVTKCNIIMLLDDNEIDNYVHAKLFKSTNFAKRVYVHTSSKSALEFLKNIEEAGSFPNELIPEYIFLDLNMPMMDGFNFLDEFEKYPTDLKSKIKVIILTTSINPDDLQKSKTYERVINYCYKPLLAKDLNNFPFLETAQSN